MQSLIFLIPLALALGGLGLWGFLWSLRSGQYDDLEGAGWRAILAASERPRVLPLPHPSWRNNGWLRTNPWFEAELLPVLRAEVARAMDLRR